MVLTAPDENTQIFRFKQAYYARRTLAQQCKHYKADLPVTGRLRRRILIGPPRTEKNLQVPADDGREVAWREDSHKHLMVSSLPCHQAVVTRLRAVAIPGVTPGIHYAMPWPIDTFYKLKVRHLRRAVI